MSHYFSKKQDSELNLKKVKSRLLGKEFEFYVIKIDVIFEKDSVAMDLIKSALLSSN